ncbi:MAG: hypothetical protein EBR09_02420 [Proteobacteria bacterium]|nr:hypothetical protein [Pseudomonadota bacterium]
MNELIPSRVELFHPMFVHFPVALLLAGVLARLLLLLFENRDRGHVFRWIFLWCWTLGSLGCIAAYLTGEEAESVVNRIICDPTLTHEHADFALYTLALSWGALFVSVLRMFFSGRLKAKLEQAVMNTHSKFKAVMRGILLAELLLVVAVGAVLVWTSHLGGKLVYTQGAGYLQTPDNTCAEDASE